MVCPSPKTKPSKNETQKTRKMKVIAPVDHGRGTRRSRLTGVEGSPALTGCGGGATREGVFCWRAGLRRMQMETGHCSSGCPRDREPAGWARPSYSHRRMPLKRRRLYRRPASSVVVVAPHGETAFADTPAFAGCRSQDAGRRMRVAGCGWGGPLPLWPPAGPRPRRLGATVALAWADDVGAMSPPL